MCFGYTSLKRFKLKDLRLKFNTNVAVYGKLANGKILCRRTGGKPLVNLSEAWDQSVVAGEPHELLLTDVIINWALIQLF